MQVLPQPIRVVVLCLASLLMLVTGLSEEASGGKSMEAFFRARGYEPVKLESAGNGMLMGVGSLAGQKIRYKIDTGIQLSGVEEAYLGHATELTNLAPNGLDAISALFASKREHLFALETLKLGRCQFMGQPMVVMAAPRRSFAEQDAPTGSRISRKVSNPQGYNLVLGWDFLVRNFAVIDCNRATLYFRGTEAPASLQATIGESLRRSGFDEISMRGTNHDPGIVLGRIKDREALFLVHTGIFASLLDQDGAKKLGLANQPIARFVGDAGVSGYFDWAPTDDIQLAGHRVGKFRIGILDLSAFSEVHELQGPSPIVGLIGMDLLSRDEAIIDCQGGRMFMRSHGK